MKTKIFAALLGVISLLCSTSFAFANQIPAGYVLVPAEAFFGSQTLAATPSAEISTTKSSVRANDEISYVGENYSLVTTTLRDNTNHPIAGMNVNLISSRATDTIKNLQPTTNSNGEAIFQVVANEEGVSALTAIVGDQALSERPRIVFLSKAGGIGGNLLRAELLAEDESGTTETPTLPISGDQVVVDFPDTIATDTPTDITISIKNSDDEIIENFIGTIEFQSSDPLAILPKSYTFIGLDRGIHAFANAVTFATSGEQTLMVSGDASLGSKEIVVAVDEKNNDNENSTTTPVITKPLDNETLNEAISLAGIAPINSNLAIFVDGQFFQNTESDVNGNFLVEIVLTDGVHEITISALRDDGLIGAVSEAITVTLDQTAPILEDIMLDPGNRVVSGEIVKIEIKSEQRLINVEFHIGDESIDLDESVELGTYIGEFTAPPEGTYFVKVVLEDIAGNIGEYAEATSMLVEPTITIDLVQLTPHDGRIDLRWNTPVNNEVVANYEISYGTSENALTKKLTTSDNRSAWFIDNLNNNTEYFFRVASFNAMGKQNGGGETVSATPAANMLATSCNSRIILKWSVQNSAIASYRLDYGITSGEYVESRILPDGASRDEWEVRDLVNGTEYFFALRGINDFGSVVADFGEVSVTPQTNAVCESSDPVQLFQRKDSDGNSILMWNAVPGATSYRVHAGTQPNIYDLATVEVGATTFRPTGLLANENYYFAVSAVFSGAHNSATISNIVKVEVGPAEILLVSIIAALGGSFLWRRKFARA